MVFPGVGWMILMEAVILRKVYRAGGQAMKVRVPDCTGCASNRMDWQGIGVATFKIGSSWGFHRPLWVGGSLIPARVPWTEVGGQGETMELRGLCATHLCSCHKHTYQDGGQI